MPSIAEPPMPRRVASAEDEQDRRDYRRTFAIVAAIHLGLLLVFLIAGKFQRSGKPPDITQTRAAQNHSQGKASKNGNAKSLTKRRQKGHSRPGQTEKQ